MTDLPSSSTSLPNNGVFCKGNLFWLYMDKEDEDNPRYRYIIYWFDVIKNQWVFSFVPIIDIRCMSLEIYTNQCICLVNVDSITLWSVKELKKFQFGQPCVNRRNDYFEDDCGFIWKLLEEISRDINSKCPGYLPFQIVHGVVVMFNFSEVHFLLYDMIIGHTNCVYKIPPVDMDIES